VYVGTQGIQVLVFDDAANGDAVPIRVLSGIETHLESVTDIVLDALGKLYSSQGETHKLIYVVAHLLSAMYIGFMLAVSTSSPHGRRGHSHSSVR